MTRIYRNIVQSNVEPEDKELIWIKDNTFYHYNNGGWEPLHMPDSSALVYIPNIGEYDITNVKQALDTLFTEANRVKTTREIFDDKKQMNQYSVNINLDSRIREVQKSIDKINSINQYSKGRFATPEELLLAYPNPKDGSYAYVGTESPYQIWLYTTKEGWVDSGETYDYLPYKIQVLPEEELESMESQDLVDGVIYFGTQKA